MAKFPKRNGIVNQVRAILVQSKVGLTTEQIWYKIDIEKFESSSPESVKVLLSQLKMKNQIRTERSICECCKRSCTLHYITEEGRIKQAHSEQTGHINTEELESIIDNVA